eukprot:sb/3463836/
MRPVRNNNNTNRAKNSPVSRTRSLEPRRRSSGGSCDQLQTSRDLSRDRHVMTRGGGTTSSSSRDFKSSSQQGFYKDQDHDRAPFSPTYQHQSRRSRLFSPPPPDSPSRALSPPSFHSTPTYNKPTYNNHNSTNSTPTYNSNRVLSPSSGSTPPSPYFYQSNRARDLVSPSSHQPNRARDLVSPPSCFTFDGPAPTPRSGRWSEPNTPKILSPEDSDNHHQPSRTAMFPQRFQRFLRGAVSSNNLPVRGQQQQHSGKLNPMAPVYKPPLIRANTISTPSLIRVFSPPNSTTSNTSYQNHPSSLSIPTRPRSVTPSPFRAHSGMNDTLRAVSPSPMRAVSPSPFRSTGFGSDHNWRSSDLSCKSAVISEKLPYHSPTGEPYTTHVPNHVITSPNMTPSLSRDPHMMSRDQHHHVASSRSLRQPKSSFESGYSSSSTASSGGGGVRGGVGVDHYQPDRSATPTGDQCWRSSSAAPTAAQVELSVVVGSSLTIIMTLCYLCLIIFIRYNFISCSVKCNCVEIGVYII